MPFCPESRVFQQRVQKRKIITTETIILPLVLYGCEIWSPMFKEEHSLK